MPSWPGEGQTYFFFKILLPLHCFLAISSKYSSHHPASLYTHIQKYSNFVSLDQRFSIVRELRLRVTKKILLS